MGCFASDMIDFAAVVRCLVMSFVLFARVLAIKIR